MVTLCHDNHAFKQQTQPSQGKHERQFCCAEEWEASLQVVSLSVLVTTRARRNYGGHLHAESDDDEHRRRARVMYVALQLLLVAGLLLLVSRRIIRCSRDRSRFCKFQSQSQGVAVGGLANFLVSELLLGRSSFLLAAEMH